MSYNVAPLADAIVEFVRENKSATKHDLEAAIPGSTRNGTLVAVLVKLGHLQDSPRQPRAPKGYRWALVKDET